MTKVRSLEELETALSSDSAWRKAELSALKVMIDPAAATHAQTFLLRSGVAILYAHWEGFVRHAAESYLAFVKSRRLAHGELTMNFVAVAVRSKLTAASNSNSVLVQSELIEYLHDSVTSVCEIPDVGVIHTKANLSSKVLHEILSTLGLDYAPYETKSKLVDVSLLERRNHIAHGRNLPIDAASYLELHDEIVNLIDEIREQFLDAATTERFRRERTDGTTSQAVCYLY